MKTSKKLEMALLAIMLLFAACSRESEGVIANENSETTLTLKTTDQTVPQTGGTLVISFNASANWTASSDQSWCHVSPSSGKYGSTSVTVTCDENDTYDERNAVVTIKCGKLSRNVTVTQKQKDGLLVSSNKVEVEAAGGEITIRLQTNVDCTCTVEEDAWSWISIVGTRALTTKDVVLDIERNEELTSRSGKITFSSGDLKEEVTIYQQGSKPTMVLTQNEYTVSSSRETIKVELRSNIDYSVQMPDVDWISVASTRAMSTYTHYFVISENTSYDSRSAEIIFKNESDGITEKVRVTQLQNNAIIVAENSYVIGREATHLDFSVNTNVDFDVSISGSWIKQVSTRALSEHKLFFDIEENTSVDDREGTITLKGGNIKQTITILQKGRYVPYLTFTADGVQTFKMSSSVESLEYSVNGEKWAKLGTSIVQFGGSYGDLRLRGKSSTGTGKYDAWNDRFYSSIISFGTNVKVECNGDIRTLLDYENYETISTNKAVFSELFKGCTSLTKAPELPATNLAHYCYWGMFSGCTSLTKAPELPATTLSYACYENMFSGCTSLTKAPELSATTLSSCYYCYSGMFKGCTSLTEAPELPATTLTYCCYSEMFSGCTSLAVAPELPATTLNSCCYSSMFKKCTSLTKAPVLPALQVLNNSYYQMFMDCEKLDYIRILATEFVVPSIDSWLSGTARKGIVVMNPEGDSYYLGKHIPSGWTIIYYNADNGKYYLDAKCTKECDDRGNQL